jgi:hypothetical protein
MIDIFTFTNELLSEHTRRQYERNSRYLTRYDDGSIQLWLPATNFGEGYTQDCKFLWETFSVHNVDLDFGLAWMDE